MIQENEKQIDFQVSVYNNKYTYIFYNDGSSKALRYGKPWIDDPSLMQGGKMILALASELYEAQKKIVKLEEEIDKLKEELEWI